MTSRGETGHEATTVAKNGHPQVLTAMCYVLRGLCSVLVAKCNVLCAKYQVLYATNGVP